MCIIALIPGLAAATPDPDTTFSSDRAEAAGAETGAGGCPVPRFSLLTCGPGDEIYELEGHTALRVRTLYQDEVVHWGLFDFDEPGFVYRFVSGETDYSCGRFPTALFLNEYVNQERWVVEQELNLTDEQALRLYELVNDNLKPENRRYRYKYLTDNCATRPLKLIEDAIGSPLEIGDDDVIPEGNTYREMMENYHANYPWYQFGIDIALGSNLDKPIDQRQKAFAPVYLTQMLSRTYYTDADSVSHMIAGEACTLNAGSENSTNSAPTPLPLHPTFVCWMICLLALVLSLRDIGVGRVTRWFDASLYAVYGLVGLLIGFLIFISSHEATTPNWLILWLNPFCLIVPLTIYTRYKRAVILFQILNIVLIAAVIVLNISHYRAVNSAFYPLMVADIARAITYLTLIKYKKSKVG